MAETTSKREGEEVDSREMNGTLSSTRDSQTEMASASQMKDLNSITPSLTQESTATSTRQPVEAFTETSVSAEVDRILNLVNVNAFIETDKPGPSKSGSETQTSASIGSGLQPAPVQVSSPSPPKESPSIPPVTAILASFVSTATPSLLTPLLRQQLYECVLDYLAVTAAGAETAPSSEPILKAIEAFAEFPSATRLTSDGPSNPLTGNTVLTRGQSFPKPYAALLNATFGHSLDFDDTHAESSLHAGVTAIPTALAEAESNPTVESDDVLLAIVLAYEITIRIGRALSSASYSRGFHMTSTAGIFGAVAAICSLRKASKEVLENAWGLAGSKAAGSMQYLSNGSHNKRLHPGFAAHDAFLCVALAEAGVCGAACAIEGDLGFLQAYTDRKREDVDWTRITENLGSHWEFSESALKPFAGCRMTHGFIELADSLGKKFRSGVWDDRDVKGVQKIRCFMPKANMTLIGRRNPNKVHPENMVDAQFSCYFQVANAFLYGMSHDMAAYDRLEDERVREMCEKVECVADESMKAMGCRIDAIFEDGNGEVAEVVRRAILEPLGERSHPFVREKVEEKFLGLMRPIYGEEKCQEVMRSVEGLTGEKKDASVKSLLGLVAWPARERH